MESNGNGQIENAECAACEQRTECVITLVEPLGQAKHDNTDGKSHDCAGHFVDPVLVNGVLDKVSNTENKHQNTNLPKEIFTDKLLIIGCLFGHFFQLFYICCRFIRWAKRRLLCFC